MRLHVMYVALHHIEFADVWNITDKFSNKMPEMHTVVHSEIRYNGTSINRNWPYNGTFF